jgi:hypothetical protein
VGGVPGHAVVEIGHRDEGDVRIPPRRVDEVVPRYDALAVAAVDTVISARPASLGGGQRLPWGVEEVRASRYILPASCRHQCQLSSGSSMAGRVVPTWPAAQGARGASPQCLRKCFSAGASVPFRPSFLWHSCKYPLDPCWISAGVTCPPPTRKEMTSAYSPPLATRGSSSRCSSQDEDRLHRLPRRTLSSKPEVISRMEPQACLLAHFQRVWRPGDIKSTAARLLLGLTRRWRRRQFLSPGRWTSRDSVWSVPTAPSPSGETRDRKRIAVAKEGAGTSGVGARKGTNRLAAPRFLSDEPDLIGGGIVTRSRVAAIVGKDEPGSVPLRVNASMVSRTSPGKRGQR